MRTLRKPLAESTGELFARPVSESLPVPATHGASPAAPAAAPNPRLSRRSLLGAMAAGLVPATAAAASGSDGEHPDARLLELGERFQQLCALQEAALETYDRCCQEALEPRRPDVLRHRLEDHVLGLNLPFDEADHQGGFSADPNLNPFYTPEEIRLLRYAPPPADMDLIPDQRVRVEEIEQASKAWLDDGWAADEVAGIHAANEAIDQLVEMKRTLGKEIAAIPAKTLAGLRVRARIVADMVDDSGEDDCTDQLVIAAIIRDILSLTT